MVALSGAIYWFVCTCVNVIACFASALVHESNGFAGSTATCRFVDALHRVCAQGLVYNANKYDTAPTSQLQKLKTKEATVVHEVRRI